MESCLLDCIDECGCDGAGSLAVVAVDNDVVRFELLLEEGEDDFGVVNGKDVFGHMLR